MDKKIILGYVIFLTVWILIMLLVSWASPSSFSGSSAGTGLLITTVVLLFVEQAMLYGVVTRVI